MRRLRLFIRFLGKLSSCNSFCVREDIQFEEEELKQVGKWIRELDINCIVVEYIWTASILDAVPENVVRVIDTHDVMHERFQSLSERAHSLASEADIAIARDREAQILQRFDVVIAINDKDAASFRALLGDEALIITYASGFWRDQGYLGKVDSYSLCQYISDFRKRFDAVCLYIGSSHAGNVDGLQRFIDITFPRLQRDANWGLIVVGDICNVLRIPRRFSSTILLLGRVNNLEPLYHGVDVVVNPVFVGSGLKIKNVEALFYGATLFTTFKGMEGFMPGFEQICFVAKSEHDMAEQMMAWLRHERTLDINKIRGYAELMASQLGFERVKAVVEDVLRERANNTGCR